MKIPLTLWQLLVRDREMRLTQYRSTDEEMPSLFHCGRQSNVNFAANLSGQAVPIHADRNMPNFTPASTSQVPVWARTSTSQLMCRHKIRHVPVCVDGGSLANKHLQCSVNDIFIVIVFNFLLESSPKSKYIFFKFCYSYFILFSIRIKFIPY